jgi:hypothetical protein
MLQFVHRLGEMPVSNLGVSVRRRDDRILLRFDDEPATIAGVVKNR